LKNEIKDNSQKMIHNPANALRKIEVFPRKNQQKKIRISRQNILNQKVNSLNYSFHFLESQQRKVSRKQQQKQQLKKKELHQRQDHQEQGFNFQLEDCTDF
jgi:hypothetical protein